MQGKLPLGNKIKILPTLKPYKPEIGDLILDWVKPEARKFLGTVPGRKKREKQAVPKAEGDQVLPLRLLNPNPWKALEALGIDADEIKAKYECPYTEYDFYAIVPAALISSDLKGKYDHVQHWNKDYLFDHEFHKDMFKEHITGLGEIGKLMLGSGWTSMTGVNDGSRSVITAIVNLDNGDQLLVYTWEWYNK
jgi:hypothetical protein